MWYVQAAFLSEGQTDDRFLTTLLTRTLDYICSNEFESPVELPDVVSLRARKGPASVEEQVQQCLRSVDSFNLFFFHHDAGSRDTTRVTQQWLEPLRREWTRVGLGQPCVEVVPIKETEAWALASGDGLRKALGATLSDAELGVPDVSKQVEKISDPKGVLAAARAQLSGPPVDVYARLGDSVDLHALQQVPSFLAMIEQLRSALVSLGMRTR